MDRTDIDTLIGSATRQLNAMPGIFRSTKTYDHNEGLSCCFRQWRADSHCSHLHGYAFAVKLVFATDRLDHRNWCFDFGSLKEVKAWLHDLLDHTTIVAEDDPHLDAFRHLGSIGIVNLRILPSVGCEALAAHVHLHVAEIASRQTSGRVWGYSC